MSVYQQEGDHVVSCGQQSNCFYCVETGQLAKIATAEGRNRSGENTTSLSFLTQALCEGCMLPPAMIEATGRDFGSPAGSFSSTGKSFIGPGDFFGEYCLLQVRPWCPNHIRRSELQALYSVLLLDFKDLTPRN